MEIIGSRKFIEIAGAGTHELPPLLVREKPPAKRMDKVLEMAQSLIDNEAIIPSFEGEYERRKMDLAIQLVEQYMGLLTHWHWGNDVLEWIRQCETTFEANPTLRRLLRPDVWPHAGRTSFIGLLNDKHVEAPGLALEKSLGLRLAFRQMPPLSCCTDQFLIYLNHSVAASAYERWSEMTPDPVSSLPPERFQFNVVRM